MQLATVPCRKRLHLAATGHHLPSYWRKGPYLATAAVFGTGLVAGHLAAAQRLSRSPEAVKAYQCWGFRFGWEPKADFPKRKYHQEDR